ncbi:ANTAR domain-containing protein [Mycobacterium decipiens]|uniref:Antitermination regulator n=1 Tax=Mycobacterium decipiens TaxID=1430326 RepID=A0A1X2LSJ0_9MYCO|nr:ANTAR domain-containing protein [Mycobacterium decipiens]OSC39663.1 antitermination regulator [Mycobacterium decipiens]
MGSTGGNHGMTATWGPAQISSGSTSGRILDTARGILIALRRCPSETAFDELHSVAQRHRLPIFEISWALVHLAVEGSTPCQSFVDAQTAARREWSQLFAQPTMTTA